jgi:hypothetical protein
MVRNTDVCANDPNSTPNIEAPVSASRWALANARELRLPTVLRLSMSTHLHQVRFHR